jgi:hypothetical protein
MSNWHVQPFFNHGEMLDPPLINFYLQGKTCAPSQLLNALSPLDLTHSLCLYVHNFQKAAPSSQRMPSEIHTWAKDMEIVWASKQFLYLKIYIKET